MRILEISNQTRKSIKFLHNVYAKYVIDYNARDELLNIIYNLETSNDPILIREALIIKSKLHDELSNILSRKFI